jgi:antitoxin component HigA of HigAB toxin-antitoxin module
MKLVLKQLRQEYEAFGWSLKDISYWDVEKLEFLKPFMFKDVYKKLFVSLEMPKSDLKLLKPAEFHFLIMNESYNDNNDSAYNKAINELQTYYANNKKNKDDSVAIYISDLQKKAKKNPELMKGINNEVLLRVGAHIYKMYGKRDIGLASNYGDGIRPSAPYIHKGMDKDPKAIDEWSSIHDKFRFKHGNFDVICYPVPASKLPIIAKFIKKHKTVVEKTPMNFHMTTFPYRLRK